MSNYLEDELEHPTYYIDELRVESYGSLSHSVTLSCVDYRSAFDQTDEKIVSEIFLSIFLKPIIYEDSFVSVIG